MGRNSTPTIFDAIRARVRREHGDEASDYLSMRYMQLRSEGKLTPDELKKVFERIDKRYPRL